MVTAKKSKTYQQNSSYLDHMALPQHEQNYFPCISPSKSTANAAFPGHYTSDFCRLNTGQQDTAGRVSKLASPYCNIPHPSGNPCLKDAQCALPHELELDITCKASAASSAPQKRFLIFDQSGNHMRLFFSPSFPPHNQILAPEITGSANSLSEEVAVQVDPQFLMRPIVEENWHENHLTDGEGEMLEDSEEIDALLYSDSGYDDDDDGENDEVTSTGHSPFIIEGGRDKDKLHEEELVEEVASSDEPPKRQRLLDGKYKKSSLASAVGPVRQPVSHHYEDDVELCCAKNSYSYDDINLGKREKKVKIGQALKILENIIPGLNSKDPLSIIDKAIVYLKSMQTEVQALGLSYPRCKSVTSN